MAKTKQFLLLLWKNYLLQRRKVVVTILEIGIPTFFAIILILIRQKVESVKIQTPTSWSAFPIESHFQDCSKLYYSPNTTNLAQEILNNANKYRNFTLVGFANEETAVEKFLEGSSSHVLAVVAFTNLPNVKSGLEVVYKLRFPATLRSAKSSLNPFKTDQWWNTQFTFPILQKIEPRRNSSIYGGPPSYAKEDFLFLQYAIDMAIIEVVGKRNNTSRISLSMKRIPFPPYIDDNFVLVIQQQFPMIIMLSFIFYSMQIVKDLVYEKEQKLKESMKLMGLSGWLHWLAWLVKYFIFIVISISIETILFCVNTGSHGRVIGFTSPSVVFVFLLLYGISTISFCFAISTFFSKANSSAAVGGLLFFLTYIPYFFLQPRYELMSWPAKIISCLLSNVAMAFGAQVIGMFEGTGAGVHWSNINHSASVDDDFTMCHVIVMLVFDSVLYAIITWYVEAIYPGDYGIPKQWYFPIQKSYWFGTSPINESGMDRVEHFPRESDPLLRRYEDHPRTSEFFENDPDGLPVGIQVKNLRKEFRSGSSIKTAVADMSLSIYEGQITVLLGHNGAGKTTTMSILTGFFPPTSGTALVNGFDIRKDISSVRNSLGLCPQHNILFDSLTVEEHLIFFTKLRGYKDELVREEVDRVLEDIDLVEKRHCLVSTLSGGMKRKLSVGIALTGGAKVVILDEPSSGMDPNARRHTWELLLRNRAGRTILLSTHFMDEADALGDRIAIMADGIVRCCGTSLFLKKKYGVGYHLTLVKQALCDVTGITNLIGRFIPAAQIESNIGTELSYVLPSESKGNFELLFDSLDNQKGQLRISSYGVSVTTLEEVFLRAGASLDLPVDIDRSTFSTFNSIDAVERVVVSETVPIISNGMVQSRDDCDFAGLDKVPRKTGIHLLSQQFVAMFMKRVRHTSRNLLLTGSQLVFPLIFTIISLVVLKTLPSGNDSPPLPLTMSKFFNPVVSFGTGHGSVAARELAVAYKQVLQSIPSLTCVNVSEKPEYANYSHPVDQFLIDMGKKDLVNFNRHFIVGLDFPESSSDVEIVNYFSNQALHASAISLSLITNTVYKYLTQNSSAKIVTVNHPMPRAVEDAAANGITISFDGFAIAVNVIFGMSFLAGSFVLFLIKERTSKAKHSQFISGVDVLIFWLSTFLWDLMNYVIPCIGIIIAFVAFDIDAYVGNGRWGDILLLFLLYGWAVLPCMYLLSFIFKVPSTGFIWLAIINIISGIGTLMTVVILSIPQLETQNVSNVLEWVFLVILPNFGLGQGLQDFYENYEFVQICDEVKQFCPYDPTLPCCEGCKDNCIKYNDNYLGLAQNGIGRMLLFLGCQGVFYFSVLLLLESNILRMMFYFLQSFFTPRAQRLHHSTPPVQCHSTGEILLQEDDDVAEERRRIMESSVPSLATSEVIVLKDLTKKYGRFCAVDRLSAGIGRGECFGLLGINGAGKTSTFQMLTGDTDISSGLAYLLGCDIKKDFHKIQHQIGYCPQFDALIEELTGRETLSMYAHLRGLDGRSAMGSIDSLIDSLLLRPYADKFVKSYSGGTKRKLSTAIALIGGPQIIFLDEPSSGMDPKARRYLWNTLSKVRDTGRTLVLTSHSMEECEALCTRIAIMVNGTFRCLGSTQHLKSKFGKGYSLIIKTSKVDDSGNPLVGPIQTFISTTFPVSTLKDVHQGLLHFHIADPSIKLGRLFGTIESVCKQFGIEDYSVSQTTLEQVFINFAQTQVSPRESQVSSSILCQAFCGCKSCCSMFCPRRLVRNDLTSSVEI